MTGEQLNMRLAGTGARKFVPERYRRQDDTTAGESSRPGASIRPLAGLVAGGGTLGLRRLRR